MISDTLTPAALVWTLADWLLRMPTFISTPLRPDSWTMDAVAYTLHRYQVEGVEIRSLGASVVVRVPQHLRSEAVQAWIQRHRERVLAILREADHRWAADNKLSLDRLYLARLMIRRDQLSDQRR